jgi:hypothetical protein
MNREEWLNNAANAHDALVAALEYLEPAALKLAKQS